MRVLHVASTFPRDDDDFTGVFLGALVAAQSEAGLDVRVVAPHAPGLPVRGLVRGVPVRRFRYAPDRGEVLAYRGGLMVAARSPAGAVLVPGYLAAMALAVRAEVRDWRPDVVHAHWWFPGGAAARAAPGPRLVVTLHGSDVRLALRGGGRAAARAVLRPAAAVAAVSPALAAEASVALGLSVDVAAMPVEVAPPPPRGPRPEGPLRVLAVGRLSPEKGFDVLVEALGLARREGVVIEAELVGAGPLEGALREQAGRLGIDLRFPGGLPPGELHRRMAAADVVVVPSRREGLGLAAVEAILTGTPVIASATGGLPGALGAPAGAPPGRVAGGVLVRPADPVALAGVLVAAAKDGVPAPSEQALEAAAHHAPDQVAERHRQLYEAALAAGNPRPAGPRK